MKKKKNFSQKKAMNQTIDLLIPFMTKLGSIWESQEYADYLVFRFVTSHIMQSHGANGVSELRKLVDEVLKIEKV